MEKNNRQLLSKAIAGDGLDWKPDDSRREKGKDRNMATRVAGKVNMAGICALSRRLIAIERARVMGKKPVDVQALALEVEARRWSEARGEQSAGGVR